MLVISECSAEATLEKMSFLFSVGGQSFIHMFQAKLTKHHLQTTSVR